MPDGNTQILGKLNVNSAVHRDNHYSLFRCSQGQPLLCIQKIIRLFFSFYPISLRVILVLYFLLRLGHSGNCYNLGTPIKAPNACLVSPMRTTLPVYLIPHDLTTLIMHDESTCYDTALYQTSLRPGVPCYLLLSRIFPITLQSQPVAINSRNTDSSLFYYLCVHSFT